MTEGRILLIDDEEEMRRSSAQALELFGLEVDTFSSAERVLELVGYAFNGVVVSDIPSFPYDILWGEREIVSIANLTRQDGVEFFARARQAKIHTTVTTYPLENANQALDDLRSGAIEGAAVPVP